MKHNIRLITILTTCLILILTGCQQKQNNGTPSGSGEQKASEISPGSGEQKAPETSTAEVCIDLTAMSLNDAYAKLQDINKNPDSYTGMQLRIRGELDIDKGKNSSLKSYEVNIYSDEDYEGAWGFVPETIEVIPKDSTSFPDRTVEVVVISGTLSSYTAKDGQVGIKLINAELLSDGYSNR